MPTGDHPSPEGERARAQRDSVGRFLDGPFADLLVSRALLAAGHDALDLGCGVGVLARRVLAVVGERGSVTAIEEDPCRLELARATGSDIAWRRGRPVELPFDDASFDAVVSCHALEPSEESVACLAEARRVLRLGGRISLAVWAERDRSPLFEAVGDVLEARLTDPAALRRLASYLGRFDGSRPERWAEWLERAGFVMVSVEEQRLDLELPRTDDFVALYLHAVGLGDALRELDPATRRGAVTEIAARLEPAARDDGNLPFRTILAFGRAWRA